MVSGKLHKVWIENKATPEVILEMIECNWTKMWQNYLCSAFGLNANIFVGMKGIVLIAPNSLTRTSLTRLNMLVEIITVVKIYANVKRNKIMMTEIVDHIWYYEINFTNSTELNKCFVCTFSFVTAVWTYSKWETLRIY